MRKLQLSLLVLTAVACIHNAKATPFILSDVFGEDDGIILNLYSDGPNQALPYRVYGPVTVDASGEYEYWDARDGYSYFELTEQIFLDNDITITIHDAPFDENDPTDTLLAEADDADGGRNCVGWCL